MIKNDLREQGFYVEFKEPSEAPITFIWTVLALCTMIISFLGIFEAMKYFSNSHIAGILLTINDYIFGLFGIASIASYLFFFILLYLGLKIIMTVLFCRDKIHSIHLKVLKGKGVPLCTCKEALKTWQTILIYLVPIVLMYSMIFALCIISKDNLIYVSTYMITFLFLSYYMALDLTLIFYTIVYKFFF
jgi:hypothetical protein